MPGAVGVRGGKHGRFSRVACGGEVTTRRYWRARDSGRRGRSSGGWPVGPVVQAETAGGTTHHAVLLRGRGWSARRWRWYGWRRPPVRGGLTWCRGVGANSPGRGQRPGRPPAQAGTCGVAGPPNTTWRSGRVGLRGDQDPQVRRRRPNVALGKTSPTGIGRVFPVGAGWGGGQAVPGGASTTVTLDSSVIRRADEAVFEGPPPRPYRLCALPPEGSQQPRDLRQLTATRAFCRRVACRSRWGILHRRRAALLARGPGRATGFVWAGQGSGAAWRRGKPS